MTLMVDGFTSETFRWLITINLHLSFQILYPLNSIAHCLINMMLSSEYRKIVKDLVTPKPGFVRVAPRSSGSSRNVSTT
ncbi:hypothetical protein CAEBREN_24864 [Caenorhabditis brenneri]|uniref:Uncharacterized protein n=1 Tax=Caenorhabditis brenneri TaxID=135651 RepID=G0M9R6_CAEBE|nr:hypothetical protein CAEBREN_24864 [Caenorhabditis brenneri]